MKEATLPSSGPDEMMPVEESTETKDRLTMKEDESTGEDAQTNGDASEDQLQASYLCIHSTSVATTFVFLPTSVLYLTSFKV